MHMPHTMILMAALCAPVLLLPVERLEDKYPGLYPQGWSDNPANGQMGMCCPLWFTLQQTSLIDLLPSRLLQGVPAVLWNLFEML